MGAPQASGVQISKRLILINSVSVIFTRTLSLTVLVWLQQWLIREVSTDEVALYTVIFSLMLFVPLIAGILGSSLSRFVIVAYARHDHREVTEITTTMFPLCLGAAVLILAVGTALSVELDHLITIVDDPTNPHAERLTSDAKIMFGILTGLSALRVAAVPFVMGTLLRQKQVLADMVGLGCELVRMATLLALMLGVEARVLWVVVASVPATLLDLAITITMSCRLVPALRVRRGAFRRDLYKPILSYGWWTLLIRLVVQVRESITLILMRNHLPAIEAAAFGVASKFDNQIRRNSLIVVPVVQPAMTAMHATGQEERLQRSYFRFGRYLVWVFTLVAVPVILFRTELWQLYLGAEQHAIYSDAELVLAILMVRLLFIFPQAPIMVISFARGLSRPVAVRAALIEGITCALAAYLTIEHDMGAVGLALCVTAVAMVGQPILFWSLGLRMTGARAGAWFRSTFIPGLLPAAVATPVWVALHLWLAPQSWSALLAAIGGGALVYAAVIPLFCLQPSEQRDLAVAIGRLRSWTTRLLRFATRS